MKCKILGCSGELGKERFPMQTGCSSSSPCCACIKCGRVHSDDGYLMHGRAGHSPFLRDGTIDMVLEDIELTPGATYKTTNWMWVEIGDDQDGLDGGAELIFDEMDEETYCFHDRGGTKYRLCLLYTSPSPRDRS